MLCCCNDVILLLLLRLLVGCCISISSAVVVEWCVPWGQHESDIDEALGGEGACDFDYDASDSEDKDDKDDGARPSTDTNDSPISTTRDRAGPKAAELLRALWRADRGEVSREFGAVMSARSCTGLEGTSSVMAVDDFGDPPTNDGRINVNAERIAPVMELFFLVAVGSRSGASLFVAHTPPRPWSDKIRLTNDGFGGECVDGFCELLEASKLCDVVDVVAQI